MSSDAVTVRDVMERLGIGEHHARALFADRGGPLPRIAYTHRVMTTRPAFERWLENPTQESAA